MSKTNIAVLGAQWGDEGKGKIVDWLSEQADIVVRFQGGHNAGHTLVIGGTGNVGRHERPGHRRCFEQGSRQALPIGRENHRCRRCDVRADIVGLAEIFDQVAFDPPCQFVRPNPAAIALVDRADAVDAAMKSNPKNAQKMMKRIATR